MNLDEVANLIKIKEYMQNSMGNFNIDKKTINEISSMIKIIDNKILSLLQDKKFKEYIGYDIFLKNQENEKSLKIKSGT